MTQDAQAGQLYGRDGSALRREDAVRRLAGADVVLFGELHGNPAVHRLELELATGLFRARQGDVVLGAEMFEADDQLVLDEYLAGLILHRHLVSEAKVWDRYEPDYRPLVELAVENGLRFVATNVPRRYANLVAREGLEALDRLSEEALRFVAPLPIRVDMATPGYREMAEMGLTMGSRMAVDPERLVAAQAVKDATMAHFIDRGRPPGKLLLHFNGVFHSQGRGGICWYLEQSDPRLDVRVVSSVEADPSVFEERHGALGDIVFVVPPP